MRRELGVWDRCLKGRDKKGEESEGGGEGGMRGGDREKICGKERAWGRKEWGGSGERV